MRNVGWTELFCTSYKWVLEYLTMEGTRFEVDCDGLKFGAIWIRIEVFRQLYRRVVVHICSNAENARSS